MKANGLKACDKDKEYKAGKLKIANMKFLKENDMKMK